LISTAGSSIRIEDFVLGGLCVWYLVVRPAVPLAAPALGIGVVGVASAVVNWVVGRVEILPALLYGVRTVEYFAVFPLLYLVCTHEDPRWRRQFRYVLVVATCIQVGVAAAQAVLGLQIGFSRFSYDRGAGLTSGPYELGAVCAALACFWLAHRNVVLAATAVAGVVLSASRISLLAVAVGLVVTAYVVRRRDDGPVVRSEGSADRPRWWHGAKPFAISVLLAAVITSAPGWFEQATGGTTSRASGTSLSAAWETAAAAADGTPIFPDAYTYQVVAYESFAQTLGVNESTSTDVSNEVRFYRWQLLLPQITAGTALLGLGPSFPGPSVDGGYLRILVETGVVGLAAWASLLLGIFRRTPAWLYGAIATLLIGSTFIDLPFAMKPAVTMWAMIAYSLGQPRGASS
jgi:hypothetical protein